MVSVSSFDKGGIVERKFAGLKVVAVAMKVIAVMIAATGAIFALVALVEALQYFDPYYIEDVLYYVQDLFYPVFVFLVAGALAVGMWAAGDLIRLLLAIEENTRTDMPRAEPVGQDVASAEPVGSVPGEA